MSMFVEVRINRSVIKGQRFPDVRDQIRVTLHAFGVVTEPMLVDVHPLGARCEVLAAAEIEPHTTAIAVATPPMSSIR